MWFQSLQKVLIRAKLFKFLQKFDADFEYFLTDLSSASNSAFLTLVEFVGKFFLNQVTILC
jgi:hypothetical protein